MLISQPRSLCPVLSSRLPPASQNIPEVLVLLIRQVQERHPIPLLLINNQSLPLPVLHLEQEVQSNSRCDSDTVADDKPSPQLRVMLRLSLTLDQLRTNDIAHTIRNKNCCGHRALLGRACNVAHADNDSLADDCAECTDDGVTSDRRGGVVGPCALPDHSAASNDGKAVDDEQNQADVGYLAGEVPAEEDCDEAECTKRELPEDGLEGRPAEGADDEGAEAGDCAVDGVSGCHEDEYEPELRV